MGTALRPRGKPQGQPLRLAAISFLNTAPLLWGLESEPRLELAYMTPAECAARLRRDEAEIGIIPVIEMARIGGLAAVPGIAIAARSEVRSILLISRCPPERIRRLALDRSSRTSAALVQILLRQRFGAQFETREQAPNWRAMLEQADAGLLIGDPALCVAVSGEARQAGCEALDLATAWHEWTGLPFVFALWAVRRAAVGAEAARWLSERLSTARAEGLRHIDAIATAWSTRLAIPEAEVRRYLRSNVEYELTPEHFAGLRRFFALAAEMRLIDSPQLPEMLE